jgi:surface antigen
MKTKLIAIGICTTFCLTACENPKQTVGAVGGGALGAWAASNIGGGSGKVVATAVGGVLGALAGSYIGGQLDKADREHAEHTAQQALENSKVGQVSEWKNPDSGHSGTIMPTRTYKGSQGRQCREYTQTIYIGTQAQKAYGKACRQPDGTWEIIN